MTERIACCIPGCRRTFKHKGEDEVICGKHWRLGPTEIRQLYTQARRRKKWEQVERLYYRNKAHILDHVRMGF